MSIVSAWNCLPCFKVMIQSFQAFNCYTQFSTNVFDMKGVFIQTKDNQHHLFLVVSFYFNITRQHQNCWGRRHMPLIWACKWIKTPHALKNVCRTRPTVQSNEFAFIIHMELQSSTGNKTKRAWIGLHRRTKLFNKVFTNMDCEALH